MICPFKHNIYPELLPFSISKHNKLKRTDQLKDFLSDKYPNLIIDPTEELIKAKDSVKVYYQLDNHWNYKAGQITAELLLSEIRRDFSDDEILDIQEFQWKDTTLQKGIHYRVLGIDELSELDYFPINNNEQASKAVKYGFPPIKGFAYPWDYERRYVNTQNESGLKVLFIRDSFGNQVIPFIKEPFKESVFIFDAWQYKLNESIIEKVKPDIVVFLGLETHIDAIIRDY